MSNDPPAPRDVEEPPFVTALVLGVSSGAARALRRVVRAINRRVLMFVWGAGTVVTFVGIVVLSITQNPGVEGVMQGLFVGFFTALLFALGMGSLILWAHAKPAPKVEPTPVISELEKLLAPVLHELTTVRRDVTRKVKTRSITRVPLGMLGGAGVWQLLQRTDDPPGLLGLIGSVFLGAVFGEGWAVRKLERDYGRLYKDRVLPKLAARVGDLTYRVPSPQRVQELRERRLLPHFDSVQADDAIVGMHHGLSVEIMEVCAKARVGNKTAIVFDGLVVDLGLPRSLTGTTIVLTDEGRWGNLKTRWRSAAMEPVRLEDPRFEERYEVYSTDQIEARALLTPAFMERFMALATKPGVFAPPAALAEANRLIIALPKGIGTGDLFEPPPYWKPAGGRILLTLEQDIRAVLRMADAVVELDFWAAGWRTTGITRSGNQQEG